MLSVFSNNCQRQISSTIEIELDRSAVPLTFNIGRQLKHL